MENPKFSPRQWVMFKMENDGAAFGKVKGGNYSKEGGWVYYVENSSTSDDDVFTVAEVDVVATSDGTTWSKV